MSELELLQSLDGPERDQVKEILGDVILLSLEGRQEAWGDGEFLRQLMQLMITLLPLIIEIIRGGGNSAMVAPVILNLSQVRSEQ